MSPSLYFVLQRSLSAALLTLPISGIGASAAPPISPNAIVTPHEVTAPQSVPSMFAADAIRVRAVDAENFESYAIGLLAPQGGWYNPHNTSQDFVVAAGISGKSARTYATADAFFTYSIGHVYTPQFGILSVSLRAPPTSTYFILGPTSDPNQSTGFLDPLASLLIDGTRALWIYQRSSAGDGYVDAGGGIAENATVRLSWDARSDGSIWFYRDGRLHFVGQSETVAIAASIRPLGGFVVGSGNQVVRSDDGTRDVVTIDDLSATLPAVTDPVGQVDVTLLVNLLFQPLGGPVATVAELGVGNSQPIQLAAVNARANTATGVRFTGELPSGFTLSNSDCGIVQNGASWNSSAQDLPGGATRICRARLRRSAAADPGGASVAVTLTSTTTDPYLTNNQKGVFLLQGLFGNGFE